MTGWKLISVKCLLKTRPTAARISSRRDGVRALEFSFVFEFHLASNGGEGGVNVGNAGDDGFLAVARGSLLRAADEAFQSGDRQALAYAGATINALVFAGLESDFFHDLRR